MADRPPSNFDALPWDAEDECLAMGQPVWKGCGECDVSFPCHGGGPTATRCFREICKEGPSSDVDLIRALYEHLEWIGWGDSYEREVSTDLREQTKRRLLPTATPTAPPSASEASSVPDPIPDPRSPTPSEASASGCMATSTPGRDPAEDDFPPHCDHCPTVFGPGSPYRRVELVLDGKDSRLAAPGASAIESDLEEAFCLVLCLACHERLSGWVRSPLAVPGDDPEAPEELDDGDLAAELEREIVVRGARSARGSGLRATGYGPGPERASLRGERKGRGDCLHCSGCYGAHTPDCPNFPPKASTLAAPCRHHLLEDCNCSCRFVGCSPETCPENPVS